MESKLIIKGESNDSILVIFGGMARQFGLIPPFEFLNFLNTHYTTYTKHFYIDIHQKWYHNGIDGISDSIDSTVEYLREEIKPYKNVIFLGTSSGGYAAILFGSLLNINKVIAFIPQTIIHIDSKYSDLKGFINPITQYFIYGCLTSTDPNHNISHCTHIDIYPNVYLTKLHHVFLPTMRDNGELLSILNSTVDV